MNLITLSNSNCIYVNFKEKLKQIFSWRRYFKYFILFNRPAPLTKESLKKREDLAIEFIINKRKIVICQKMNHLVIQKVQQKKQFKTKYYYYYDVILGYNKSIDDLCEPHLLNNFKKKIISLCLIICKWKEAQKALVIDNWKTINIIFIFHELSSYAFI